MPRKKIKRQSTSPEPDTPAISLSTALSEALDLIEQGSHREAIHLLEPLAARYPGSSDLHAMLGNAYGHVEEWWKVAIHYEKALSLGRDKSLIVPLGFAYLELDLKALALRTLRQALKVNLPDLPQPKLDEIIQGLEDELLDIAIIMNLPPDRLLRGLRYMEEGQIALQNQAYAQSIHVNRNAIRLLGDFPPPHNNLSLALFFHGQPDDAIQTARSVLERDPVNIQALSNLVRFLAWTGQIKEARQVWDRMKPLTPVDHSTRMKIVEAAAFMDSDEDVYRLLKGSYQEDGQDRAYSQREQLYLVVAEANLGHKTAAIRRLRKLAESIPWAGEMLNALQEGKSGLGWSERYPYVYASELVPDRELKSILDLFDRKDGMPANKFRREVERYVTRYPQLHLLGKKFLLEDQQTKQAIAWLSTLGTPEAFAFLREFALSQVGDDEARLHALFTLSEAGEVSNQETVHFWRDGEWRDIKLKTQEIRERAQPSYSLQVHELLDEALQTFHENRLSEAERKFKRVLSLEPQAKEAYNNLAVIYARQEKHDQARAMFQKALAVDPLYLMPRCNLAIYLLDEEKVDEAEAMIAPLTELSQLNPQGMVFLSYVRARLHLERDEIDKARNTLEIALQVVPDYKPAKELLERMNTYEQFEEGWSEFYESQHRRDMARRARKRLLITTPDPNLHEALGIYTKEILTHIAHRVIPWGGWSTFKKAQLHRYLVEHLTQPRSFAYVLEVLTPEEKAAFNHVLKEGGSIAWEDFVQEFDDDLEESPYWQYHEPETIMGRLRAYGLLFEATVEGRLMVTVPVELRKPVTDDYLPFL
jgi:tetratricopeptide (TPR) repeat protein